jgi:hypothetical protein
VRDIVLGAQQSAPFRDTNDSGPEDRSFVRNGDARYRVQFVDETAWQDPAIRSRWEVLLERHWDGATIFQSPQVFEYLAATGNRKDLALLTVFDASGSLVGVIPAAATETELEFKVGSHCLGTTRMHSTVILGIWPSIPSDDALYDCVLAMLDKRFPDCEVIRLNAVPTASLLWQYVQRSGNIRDRYYAYVPYGPRGCHTMPLPDTFEQYLAKYGRKKKYNLRRQLKLLRDHGNGLLELRRLESREDLPSMFEAMKEIMGPRVTRDVLSHDTAEMLASTRLLLSYVLVCGGRPCAIAVGARLHFKYSLGTTACHPEFRQYSAGTTLQYLMVDDLLRNRIARHIDFGFGEPIGPYRSTNVIVERATVLLFQKSLANRMRIASHSLFSSLARCIKIVLGSSNGCLLPTDWRTRSSSTSDQDVGEP